MIINKQTINNRKEQLNKAIKNAKKKGVSSSFIDSLNTNEIARMSKKNFDKKIQVIKERPSIEKTLKTYKEKAKTNIAKQVKRDLIKKAKSFERKTGIHPSNLNTTKFGVPNSEIVKLSLEEYIEARKLVNSFSDKPLKDTTIKTYATKEYNKLIETVKETALQGIEKASIDYANNFVDTYFKYSMDSNNTRIIKKHIEMLPIQKRYDLMEVLTSAKFKKQYDSDPKNSGYDANLDEGERAYLRQLQIINILQNETGKVIKTNGLNYEVSDHQKQRGTVDTFASNMD